MLYPVKSQSGIIGDDGGTVMKNFEKLPPDRRAVRGQAITAF
jgi:hypothetical protein